MPSLGGWEFVILIGILVLLFGAKRLPDMARSIGQSARVFKGEMKGMKGEEPSAGPKTAEPAPAPARPAEPVPPAALPPAVLPPAAAPQEAPQQRSPAVPPGPSSTGQ